MKKDMLSKMLVLGVILLFIGMGIQPAFANDVSFGIERQQPRGGTFIKTYGGKYDDSGRSVQQTNDGGYIITGNEGDDIWLIKTDSVGNKEWDKTFYQAGWYDYYAGNCVRQTSDGGYIITGFYHYERFNTFFLKLIKTDSTGNMEWDRSFEGNKGYCIQQTTDGGYIITGITLSDPESYDVGLIKTNNNGYKQWDKTFHRNNDDKGYYVQQTTDGGYILTGADWLIKTDNDGNEMWGKLFVGNLLNFVQQTTDGGYIITGERDSDVWLIKTDNTGNKEWENTFPGITGFCVRQTTDGGYIITGDIMTGLLKFNRDVCLIKTDEYGNVKNKAVSSSLLLRLLERFPLLQRLIDFWRLNIE